MDLPTVDSLSAAPIIWQEGKTENKSSVTINGITVTEDDFNLYYVPQATEERKEVKNYDSRADDFTIVERYHDRDYFVRACQYVDQHVVFTELGAEVEARCDLFQGCTGWGCDEHEALRNFKLTLDTWLCCGSVPCLDF